jgi:hypothetical protein
LEVSASTSRVEKVGGDSLPELLAHLKATREQQAALFGP